ncbi:8-oxo-dGTP diphosphatase [Patescibacteria group bacterium]|nr:8-oxo-dGTP diphosphatase [Patescibacteria group bacterium]MBU2263142.1 8-oxo-dGTP diphosphatase [Patescibacteria group bacterium]
MVLLGMKKRGFGAGRWNGFGGKVNEGEEIIEAARRELLEEARIIVDKVEHVGILDFFWKDKSEVLEVNIFKANDFKGEPVESEEMKPEWFHIDEIPFMEMWPDDKYWFPLFLKDRKFIGRFLFDDSDNILEQELREMQSLNI